MKFTYEIKLHKQFKTRKGQAISTLPSWYNVLQSLISFRSYVMYYRVLLNFMYINDGYVFDLVWPFSDRLNLN